MQVMVSISLEEGEGTVDPVMAAQVVHDALAALTENPQVGVNAHVQTAPAIGQAGAFPQMTPPPPEPQAARVPEGGLPTPPPPNGG